MAENSKIEWTDHTFNPWEGCQKVGPGCDHCYAETRNARYVAKESPLRGTAPNWGPGAPRRRTSASNWWKPLAWQRDAKRFLAEHGRRQRVFCASLADVFDNAVDPAWRADLFELIRATPDLDWLLLTKRIGNAANMLPVPFDFEQLYPNVWLGATIVNQAEADRDIPKLLATPAAVRFLSMEPLLGPVDLRTLAIADSDAWDSRDVRLDALTGYHRGTPALSGRAVQSLPTIRASIDWVIVGGESGAGARPMHPAWARGLRDQCAGAGVPMLFKQWGEWAPKSSVDGYWHGADKRQRQHPNSPGIAWLADGRICMQDFTVAEHARRITSGEASSTRAVEVDNNALAAFHATLDDPEAKDVGLQWMYRVGKATAGRLLDGVTHDGFPAVSSPAITGCGA